jgi:NitT/TauT family transport system permease protein
MAEMTSNTAAYDRPVDTNPIAQASPAYRAYLRSLRRQTWLVRLYQIGILGAVLAIWEIAPRAGWVNPMLTSYPSAVWASFRELAVSSGLFNHALATLTSTLIGFVGGMLLGIVIAIALWLSPTLHRILDPFIVVLNALPKIALVPLFYIWLGDVASIYAMAISVSVFVTVIMLYTGFQAIDVDKVKLARLFGASKLQLLTKIVLPGSVPTMMSALKVNIGLTLVGVIVGEFQSAKAGLGYLISYGSQIFQMNLVMLAIVLLAVISSVLFAVVQLLESLVRRRRGVR